MDIELDRTYQAPVYIEDVSGNFITGLQTGDFAIKLTNNGGVDKRELVGNLSDVGSGDYYLPFTPDQTGTWYFKIEHPEYGIYKNSYICNERDGYLSHISGSVSSDIPTQISDLDSDLVGVSGMVYAISGEVDTLEEDLESYMDSKETNIISEIDGNETKLDNLSGYVDRNYKTVTGAQSSIITQINDNESKIDILTGLNYYISGVVDTMEVDLKSYMDTKETNIVSEIDENESKLDVISGLSYYISGTVDTMEIDLKSYMDTKETNIISEVDANETKLDNISGYVDRNYKSITGTREILSSKVDNLSGIVPTDLEERLTKIAGLMNHNSILTVDERTATGKGKHGYLELFPYTGHTATGEVQYKYEFEGEYNDRDHFRVTRFWEVDI